MTIKRAALLTAGPLVALGLSTALAHAEGETLFSGDGYTITDPDALTGGVEVGGVPGLDSDYEYADQPLTLAIGDSPVSAPGSDVYQATDVFGGSDTLVDLTPGQSIADSDIFDTFSIGDGAVVLQHVYIGDPGVDGLTAGEYNSIDFFGTTFVTPEFLDTALGPDYGLTLLDVDVLTQQADVAAALDVTPITDILTSLF